MKDKSQIKLAVICAPGHALFGTDLLDITIQAWEKGINLTGADIREARAVETGVLVSGACEDKHYSFSGKIDN
jgi:hypothetical protein